MILANVATARGARASAHADAVPRARRSRRRRSWSASSRRCARSASRRAVPEDVTTRDLQAIARARAGSRPSAPSSSRWSCARCRRRCTSRPTSGTSGSRSRTTRTSPRRSAAIRTSSCIARIKALHRRQERRGACATTRRQLDALGESTSRLEKRADEADRYVVQLPQVHLPARAHRADLRRAHHDGGGVRLLRADPRCGGRWPAAHRQPARR